MTLVFDENHPFSLNYKLEIPVYHDDKLYYSLAEFNNVDFEILIKLVKSKFYNNLHLAYLFSKFKSTTLIPKVRFHEDEQEALQHVAFHFNNMDVISVPDHNYYFYQTGKYKAFLDDDFVLTQMKIPKLAKLKEEDLIVFEKQGEMNVLIEYYVKVQKDHAMFISKHGNTSFVTTNNKNWKGELNTV